MRCMHNFESDDVLFSCSEALSWCLLERLEKSVFFVCQREGDSLYPSKGPNAMHGDGLAKE